jgi:acyl carrier protein
MESKTEIYRFVQALLVANGDNDPLTESSSLVLSGRLASVDTVEIVVFLEEHWGIDFAKIGFDPVMLDTMDAINALVKANAAPSTTTE